MGLIAGCFAYGGLGSGSDFLERVRGYGILGEGDAGPYVVEHAGGRWGEVAAKYRAGSAGVRTWRGNGVVVLTLGYHDCDYSAAGGPAEAGDGGVRGRVEAMAKLIEQSEGDFVSIVTDESVAEVHVVNNRWAQRPFYLLCTESGVWFSSNIMLLGRLAPVRLEADPLGWLQIFSYSHTMDERTNCLGVVRLRPGSHVAITPAGLRRESYWRLRYEVDEPDPEDYAEKVFASMRSSCAVRTSLSKEGFVALSGGLDSRLVAAAMRKDCGYFAFTFVNSTQDEATLEVSAARQVAEVLGLEHKVVRIDAAEVSRSAAGITRLVGGLLPIHHSVKSYQYLREMLGSTRYMIGGGPGDVLAGSYIPSVQYTDAGRSEELTEAFGRGRKKFSREALGQVFRSEVLAEHYVRLDESMRECFGEVTGPTAAHRVTAWAMSHRQPAFTFTSSMHTHPDVMSVNPHLGYAYTELMLRLPAEWLYGKAFYQYMIYRCLPRLRGVVYANTGKVLSGQRPGERAAAAWAAWEAQAARGRRLRARVKSKVPGWAMWPLRKTVYRQPVRRSFEYALMRGDERLHEEMIESLHSCAEARELFDVDGCARYVRGFGAGRLVTGSEWKEAELMGSLATACYWFAGR